MTVVYRRATHVLCRDSGEVVLVLVPGGDQEVQVLSGGSALLWRSLAAPASAGELARRLSTGDEAEDDAVQVGPEMLLPVLEDLAQRGLLSTEQADA